MHTVGVTQAGMGTGTHTDTHTAVISAQLVNVRERSIRFTLRANGFVITLDRWRNVADTGTHTQTHTLPLNTRFTLATHFRHIRYALRLISRLLLFFFFLRPSSPAARLPITRY